VLEGRELLSEEAWLRAESGLGQIVVEGREWLRAKE
jgi:hypothetical protein